MWAGKVPRPALDISFRCVRGRASLHGGGGSGAAGTVVVGVGMGVAVVAAAAVVVVVVVVNKKQRSSSNDDDNNIKMCTHVVVSLAGAVVLWAYDKYHSVLVWANDKYHYVAVAVLAERQQKMPEEEIQRAVVRTKTACA